MPEKSDLKLAAFLLISGLLASVLLLDIETNGIIVVVVAAVITLGTYLWYDRELTDKVLENASTNEAAFQKSEKAFSDFDDIWEALQNWYAQDPRNGELVWQNGLSKFETTVPNNVDGKFRFVAILTPSKNTRKNVFCCVETSTKSLLTWDEKASVNRNDLFSSVRLVEDIQERRHVSAEEMQQRIMGNRMGGLGQGTNWAGVNTDLGPDPEGFSDDQEEEEGDGDR